MQSWKKHFIKRSSYIITSSREHEINMASCEQEIEIIYLKSLKIKTR